MNQLQKQVTVNETGGDVLVDIRHIVDRGTLEAYQGVNTVMVLTYWKVGRGIVEEEQHGAARAAYGAGLIDFLAAELSKEFREASREMWSSRTLDRNIGSQYYNRLLQSPSKEEVVTEYIIRNI